MNWHKCLHQTQSRSARLQLTRLPSLQFILVLSAPLSIVTSYKAALVRTPIVLAQEIQVIVYNAKQVAARLFQAVMIRHVCIS
jgi:hypothetical protein